MLTSAISGSMDAWVDTSRSGAISFTSLRHWSSFTCRRKQRNTIFPFCCFCSLPHFHWICSFWLSTVVVRSARYSFNPVRCGLIHRKLICCWILYKSAFLPPFFSSFVVHYSLSLSLARVRLQFIEALDGVSPLCHRRLHGNEWIMCAEMERASKQWKPLHLLYHRMARCRNSECEYIVYSWKMKKKNGDGECGRRYVRGDNGKCAMWTHFNASRDTSFNQLCKQDWWKCTLPN